MKHIGEFQLIKQLTKILEIKDKNVLVGFGDDCACVNVEGKKLVFTADIQIENVHFLKDKVKPTQLGWKLISVNVSDVVACGGVPKWAVISIAVPKNINIKWLKEVYKGIKKALDFYKFDIIGGNTSSSSEIIFDLFLTGETEKFVSRSGAKPGDYVFISGHTGLSRAGLELLLMDKKDYEDFEKRLIKTHLEPVARIDLQEKISRYATACIDISDGLVGDLGHISENSKVKIILEKEKIPISADLEKYCKKYNKNPYDYILYGGEDYQLAFTIKKEDIIHFKNEFLIGIVEKGEGIYLDNKKLKEKGFEHI